MISALVGLFVFYGTLLVDPVAPAVARTGRDTSEARSALTAFLVLSGLLLVPFVAPPSPWFAVVDPVVGRPPAGHPHDPARDRDSG